MRTIGYRFCASVALVMALLGAPLVEAVETTRTEYVAAAEPICKTNTRANERILKGVKTAVKKGSLKPAAAKLAKAAVDLRKTLSELRHVPQPPADQVRLARWLGYIKTEAKLFSLAARKLKAGNRIGAQAMALRLNNNATLANNTVVEFEFVYCRFEPSRFM